MKVVIMFIARGLIRYTFLIAIVVITLICSLGVKKAEGSTSIDYEVPIYNISISENTQRDIQKLCEKNHLSYELVLAIYQTEGVSNIQIDEVKADIEELVYIRDYWALQGFPDEVVFDLMLLSRQRGIEGCILYMQETDNYYLDSYVQKVTEYKYYLEQSLDGTPVSNEWHSFSLSLSSN